MPSSTPEPVVGDQQLLALLQRALGPEAAGGVWQEGDLFVVGVKGLAPVGEDNPPQNYTARFEFRRVVHSEAELAAESERLASVFGDSSKPTFINTFGVDVRTGEIFLTVTAATDDVVSAIRGEARLPVRIEEGEAFVIG